MLHAHGHVDLAEPLWLLPRFCRASLTRVGCPRATKPGGDGGLSQRHFEGQLADTPGLSAGRRESPRLQQCKRSVHVEVRRWPALAGGGGSSLE